MLRSEFTRMYRMDTSYLDLKVNTVHMGIATSTFYDIAEDVIEAIIESLSS